MTLKLPLIAVNGVLHATISPLDRGFSYGDGVFETCRVHQGKIPLWRFHVERLIESAERLKIPLAQDLLMHYRDQLLIEARAAKLASGVLKITLTRGLGGRGYKLPDEITPTYCLGLFAASELHSAQYLKGANVRVCTQRLGHSAVLAGMKHLNRLEHILARSEWRDEYDEGLLLDGDGQVIEATLSNLFVVLDGCLITPDLSFAGVAGIMRRLIIEQLAPALGLKVSIQPVDLLLVRAAHELFLCNSVFGIWPVTSLADGNLLSLPLGPITQSLQRRLEAFLEQA
jgi:4-amino-4-deoxychorismate lyase